MTSDQPRMPRGKEQRRTIELSDPQSGRLPSTTPAMRRSLVDAGLAQPHGRTGALYLTAAGRAVRDRLVDHAATAGPRTADPSPARFVPATGDGPAHASESRAAEVAAAWASVQEMRRVWGQGAPEALAVPAEWERAQQVRAVAIALEAAGATPSAVADGRRTREGYRVIASDDPDDPGEVRVEWRGPDAARARLAAKEQLLECSRLLASQGWESLLYKGAGASHFLVAWPRELP